MTIDLTPVSKELKLKQRRLVMCHHASDDLKEMLNHSVIQVVYIPGLLTTMHYFHKEAL